jgi:hypothetical protein
VKQSLRFAWCLGIVTAPLRGLENYHAVAGDENVGVEALITKETTTAIVTQGVLPFYVLSAALGVKAAISVCQAPLKPVAGRQGPRFGWQTFHTAHTARLHIVEHQNLHFEPATTVAHEASTTLEELVEAAQVGIDEALAELADLAVDDLRRVAGARICHHAISSGEFGAVMDRHHDAVTALAADLPASGWTTVVGKKGKIPAMPRLRLVFAPRAAVVSEVASDDDDEEDDDDDTTAPAPGAGAAAARVRSKKPARPSSASIVDYFKRKALDTEESALLDAASTSSTPSTPATPAPAAVAGTKRGPRVFRAAEQAPAASPDGASPAKKRIIVAANAVSETRARALCARLNASAGFAGYAIIGTYTGLVYCNVCKKNLVATSSGLKKHDDRYHVHQSMPAVFKSGVFHKPLASIASRRLFVASGFAAGQSTAQLAEMRSLSQLVSSITPADWSGRSTVMTDVYASTDELRDDLKVLVAGRRAHMVLDSSRTSFNRVSNCTLVYLLVPGLRPILADTIIGNEAADAVYYSNCIQQVIKDWKVGVRYVTADNTNVMPAAIARAKLTFVPCLTHILNLCCNRIVTRLEIVSLISGIRQETESAKRKRLLEPMGISTAMFDCPSHRFAVHTRALEWLAVEDNRMLLVRGLRKLATAKSLFPSDQLPSLRALIEHLEDQETIASIYFANMLCADLPEAIALSESVVPSADLVPTIDRIWQHAHDVRGARSRGGCLPQAEQLQVDREEARCLHRRHRRQSRERVRHYPPPPGGEGEVGGHRPPRAAKIAAVAARL